MSEKETDYEGKKKLYLDIDRMINEGMAGGTVAHEYDLNQISYSTEIGEEEEPPIRQEEDKK
ncbi:hypothetical protein QUF84_05460 [Fictibacillus enclensis]|uniref:Uncharacterized protein n=1 Tax=Fictibacillus enclensis TaxID=1017270 RepID=A0A0V8J1C5_9BACL|nr:MULTISPECIES: hypothetical protein [Fictibacillus]KSU80910.1 hypothetical protein AS030_18310 [Fictibacillus enclensis]MDM5197509.1 hypothetical protein [Fictibacillus enclensis]MDM5336676.1 hypothetical protein [Fictibacillus enclensis]RXZ00443.1 hypothetical protein DMO16_12610 [Fictibacillus sp. S7]WHY73109.1 hypothetical protein QNH15_04010 [Fictibacillus enclensis]